MRKVLFILLVSAPISMLAGVRVEVSETVELTSVLAKLAGFEEYNQDYGTSYKQDIEEWFEPYRDHASVSYFRRLRTDHYIMYDAVASIGIHLYIEDQKIKMQDNLSLLESRWLGVDYDKLVAQLTSFYQDSRFHDFFVNHQSVYDEKLNSFRQNVFPYVHEDWYPKFYGTESKENFVVVLAFNNGTNGYGCERQLSDGTREAYSVIGIFGWMDIARDAVDFSTTIIHEFNHSFVNPILENSQANQDLLRESGEWFYNLLKWTMQNQSYGNWQTMINESIVRAGEVIYRFDNNYTADQIEQLAGYQIARGFLWTPELVEQLRIYSQNRDKYKTLADFYPELIKCINSFAEKERERFDRCLKLPEAESFNTMENDVMFKFQTNRDTPTTVTLVGAALVDKKPIVIPSTANGYPVKTIGREAFLNNQNLTKVVISEGVESIQDEAFLGCSLNEITLPSTLKSIGNWALECPFLTQLYIPASVVSLGTQCVSNSRITSMIVDKDNPVFDSRDNCNAIIETATNTLIHGSLGTVIPESVTAIGVMAFKIQQQMTTITIPSWITSIGDGAFQYCTALKTIYCEIEKPFPINEDVFVEVTDKATLYVPYGTKQLYQSTQGWNLFNNIVEMDKTSVREVTRQAVSDNVVYDLKGSRVESPTKGLYIRNGKKELYHSNLSIP